MWRASSLTFFSSSSLSSEAMTDVRASLSVLVRSEADMAMLLKGEGYGQR